MTIYCEIYPHRCCYFIIFLCMRCTHCYHYNNRVSHGSHQYSIVVMYCSLVHITVHSISVLLCSILFNSSHHCSLFTSLFSQNIRIFSLRLVDETHRLCKNVLWMRLSSVLYWWSPKFHVSNYHRQMWRKTWHLILEQRWKKPITIKATIWLKVSGYQGRFD